MPTDTPYLIVVAGPTAVGKTNLAIQLATHFKTEILSADSRQFYTQLNIGVAKPTPQELNTVPHHFIGHLPVTQNYTAAHFEQDAMRCLSCLYTQHKIAVLVGGSGLFINALLNGLDNLPSNPAVRNELETRLINEGLPALAQELKVLDKESFDSIDTKNPRRLIRALEICLVSGKKASELKNQSKINRGFIPLKIALDMDRNLLYQRINQRVDEMLQNGLVEEARQLIPHKTLNALQTVGYKELFDYFEGTTTLETAIELIKQHTRNYAKRQLTWFRKDTDYTWFNPSQILNIIDFCEQQTSLP